MKPGGKSFQKRMQEAQAKSKDCNFFGGGHRDDRTASWPRLLTPSLSLKCTFCSLCPHWELFQGQHWESKGLLRPFGWNMYWTPLRTLCQRHRLQRVRGCWDLLDGICDWTPLRTLYKALRFSGSRGVSCMEIYSFCSQTSFAGKFPCLFTQSSTNLEWSAFSPVSPCPPCMGAMNQHDCIHCCCRNKPRGAIKVLLSDFIVKTHQACNFDPALDLRRLR